MPSLKRRVARLLLPLSLACAFAAQAAPPPAAAQVDPLEASLAGEFALQSGQLPEAARRYLDAARAADDPVLAERATRIALLADDDALARDAYTAWTRLAPDAGNAQRMVAAGLALRDGNKRLARRELRALLAEKDGWPMALAALMGAVGKQQKLVVAMVEDIVARDLLPRELAPWLGLGGLAQRLEQPKLVDRIIGRIVERFPDEPRVGLMRAQLLREGGKLDEARRQLAGLEPEARRSRQMRAALAGEYQALGDPARAAEVLAWGPQDDNLLGYRARLLDLAGDKDALSRLYEELKRDASRPSPPRRLLLGQVAELLERHQEALDWYANIPGSPGVARLQAANVLHAMGRHAEAYEAARALQADALLEDELRRAGYLLEAELRAKDKDAAGEADAYARGLAAFADDQALLYARALMWERQDDIARAEADFRRILVIAPDDVHTLNALGYTLADRTNRYREALELIDRARVAEPGNAAIIDSYGWVLFRLGKTRQALDHLRHAYALQKDADIASHLGQVLWVLGQKDEARRYFDEARKLDPENRSLQRALREVGL
ncbi:tetratricopeptide repeat protein [Thermomonas brevis]